MTPPLSIPSFTTVHLKTSSILSIPTEYCITKVRSDPKCFVNVSRVAGQQTFRNRRSVETKVSLAPRLYFVMVIRSRRTNSWAIPMALSQAIASSTPLIVGIARDGSALGCIAPEHPTIKNIRSSFSPGLQRQQCLLVTQNERMNVTHTSDRILSWRMGILSHYPWGVIFKRPSLPAPSYRKPPTQQPSYTLRRPLQRSNDGVRAYQLALRMTTIQAAYREH
ncbi:hypothetical protein EDB85DRAFT_512854 [Lactarius pseudohatsudake]|nr:hypothetical protein EDB85DRAFT_512854 [Lactarius pseudohatsudake]